MEAAGSQLDAIMSDSAPQTQQNVEIDEPVAVASKDAKDKAVQGVEEKKAKLSHFKIPFEGILWPQRSLLGSNRPQESFIPFASLIRLTKT